MSETHTFGPTWVMENNFNYLRNIRTEAPVDPIGSMADPGSQVPPRWRWCRPLHLGVQKHHKPSRGQPLHSLRRDLSTQQ